MSARLTVAGDDAAIPDASIVQEPASQRRFRSGTFQRGRVSIHYKLYVPPGDAGSPAPCCSSTGRATPGPAATSAARMPIGKAPTRRVR